MSLYDTVRANVDSAANEERVEVNQRALIDKILARYASAGAVYRELLQNSNDAEATVAEIYFTTNADESSLSRRIVTSVQYRNNGLPFRPQDWARLKKIAEGNPDESKIGAFGVGAYTMFSICEEPLVLSGNQALAFVWKGDALWTKTVDNDNGKNHKGWTSFILPARDPYPLPNLVEFGEFLCASLTFTKCLSEIRVFVDDKRRMTITKTQLQEPTVVQIHKNSSWWKSDGAVTASPNGLFSLKDENSLLETFYHIQVTLDGETAAVTARFLSAVAKTKIPAHMTKRMERVTKKKPPSKVEVQIFLNGQQQRAEDSQSHKRNKAYKIMQSFSPRIGEGRIFIGFRTSQTTGLAAHLAAPFVPTVEREAMDLQDQTLRVFNMELLEFAGILMRLTLEHGMSALGVEYAKGAAERAKLEEQLLKQEADKLKPQTTSSSTASDDGDDETVDQSEANTSEEGSTTSRVWGFAKFMAKGVKKTLVKVVNKVEELVDDGGELLHPRDPRPLCAEEHQAILLMQSFCPRQSTPDPTVGMALAQGFSRCLPDKAPPVLTRSGVVSGDNARLPYKGLEAFCSDGVVRSIVFQNAEEYHNVIAQCQNLSLSDLSRTLEKSPLDEEKLIRLLKWWVRYSKIHPNVCSQWDHIIKENIQFFMNYKEDKDTLPVFKLKDYLFFLDKERMQAENGFSIDSLPMPESVLPKMIQDSVTIRTLTDSSLQNWFAPLPFEIWVEFISHHPCMNSGQPEDEKLLLQVLSTLSNEYGKRSLQDRSSFGGFCQSVLKERRCIPFDSTEPLPFSADCPSNLYLYSAELEAFDGVGNFRKVSQSLKHKGITDDFLVALGVRKSVAIDFLFSNLDNLKWNSDPKPLIEYLRTATLTSRDIAKLKSTQYLPCENDVSRMFSPHELYLPDREFRIFPFVRLLQWPSQDEITERSQNGRFLVELGVKKLPPLHDVLNYISFQVEDDSLRVRCLEYVSKRLGSGGPYQDEYARTSRADKLKLKFMPCVVMSPLDGEEKKGLYSVLTCCSDDKCAVMGFPVIDPNLGNSGKLFGTMFHCVKEPAPAALVQQLLMLVASAKRLLLQTQATNRAAVQNRIMKAFQEIFQYLSTRTSELGSSLIGTLEKEDFIPCIVSGEVQWFGPNAVFFKNDQETGDSITESLFQVVDFSPFLAAVGVKQEASTKDIFRLMIESPQAVLSALKSEEKYRMFLRRVAAHRPFRHVTQEIRESKFLLAYSVQGEEGNEATHHELAKARDIFIIDNSFFGRMFPVLRAPHESDLEDFYALIGAKYISKEVDKKFDVVGIKKQNTSLTKALLQRIHERSPLLVSPSVTSRPLVANAASVLEEKNLEVVEVQEVKAVYSLNRSVRSQQTTCCAQAGSWGRRQLCVTADFDWFDVGYALGELILQRCQLEDAFFISSILEAPLDQLRARGFPVDRIMKPEPEPEAPKVPKKTETDASKSSRGAVPSLSPTVAEIPESAVGTTSTKPEDVKKNEDVSKSTPTMSRDGYVNILKQMYPEAKEEDIRKRLGENPTLEQVRTLAEAMAVEPSDDSGPSGETHEPAMGDRNTRNNSGGQETTDNKSSSGQEAKDKNKFLGSKKLGRAFNGLRGSTFGGATGYGGRTEHSLQGGNVAGPSRGTNPNTPVPPAVDASSHSNMEKMLQNTVQTSRAVDPRGVSSPDSNVGIPEGLERGDSCEVIPGQDLKPFLGQNEKGETHNGIKIFSARKHPSSHQFVLEHIDMIESFGVVLERLCGVFGLSMSAVAIFHDPTGGVIAFNSNRALHFNVRFFGALHYSQNLHQSRVCYSYWYTVFCHEMAHHLCKAHNKDHGFYTESYVSLYLPKFMALASQLK